MDNRDSDSDDDVHPPENRPMRPARIALHNFLQLLAAPHEVRGPAANTNEELVNHLWSSGAIHSPAVKRALLACPRHLFVPENLQDEAYVDAPLRVQDHGFNISAPHIHGTALEALELSEGDRFLDVGCGCGVMSAAGAQLVGPKGSVTALDIRQAALDMSQKGVERLREDDEDYCANSCVIRWERHNIFFPTKRLTGKFNKVYIGAACPRARLKELIQLLEPEGGLLLSPVDSELVLFKRLPNGRVGKRVLSAVRFSELEVPRDVEVVLACIEEERKLARTLTHPPSTFNADMAGLLRHQPPAARAANGTAASGDGGSGGGGSSRTSSSSSHSFDHGQQRTHSPACDDHMMSADPCDHHHQHQQLLGGVEAHQPASIKRHKTGLARAPSYLSPDLLARLGPTDCFIHGGVSPPAPTPAPASMGQAACDGTDADAGDWCFVHGSAPTPAPATPAPAPAVALAREPAGPYENGDMDAEEEAGEWRLPAHRAVLQARCEHLRAQFLSGMRDAGAGEVSAPEGVSRSAVGCLLHHVYEDQGVDALPLEQVSEVLHLAAYFGCPHLTSLCEERLAAVLIKPEDVADEVAAQLLSLADEVALPQLKTLALSYIVEHYRGVSTSESYASLPRHLVDAVTEAACNHTTRVMEHLTVLAGGAGGGLGGRGDDTDGDL